MGDLIIVAKEEAEIKEEDTISLLIPPVTIPVLTGHRRRCSYPMCQLRNSSENIRSALSRFSFPNQSKPEHEQWVNFVRARQIDFTPDNNSVLCERHFLPHQINSYRNGKRLAGSVVPTVHFDPPGFKVSVPKLRASSGATNVKMEAEEWGEDSLGHQPVMIFVPPVEASVSVISGDHLPHQMLFVKSPEFESTICKKLCDSSSQTPYSTDHKHDRGVQTLVNKKSIGTCTASKKLSISRRTSISILPVLPIDGSTENQFLDSSWDKECQAEMNLSRTRKRRKSDQQNHSLFVSPSASCKKEHNSGLKLSSSEVVGAVAPFPKSEVLDHGIQLNHVRFDEDMSDSLHAEDSGAVILESTGPGNSDDCDGIKSEPIESDHVAVSCNNSQNSDEVCDSSALSLKSRTVGD